MIRAATTLLFASIAVWGQSTRDLEKQIDKRNKDNGGILVSEPKIFDDSLLQQMLNAAEAKLASMQVLDAGSIGSHLGALAGGTQTVNGLAISAQTPSLPGVSTVANGATGSTVNTVAAAPTGTTTTNQVTAGQPSTNVTTTVPSFSPPTATLPAPTTSLPTNFGISSSNILNEQMQLTYEIANLRLLLEGSLSDRFVEVNGQRSVRPRTTVGFSITLTPRYKNAVAIVEVEVEKAQGTDISAAGEAPIVTALLPQEKTYNVASIRESNLSIGVGAVTQVFGVAGSFFHGSKSFYLVQDQDTVALPIPVADKTNQVSFLWQFRPVLGQEYLASGSKQTFVQLAFPTAWSVNSFGSVSVITYWCKYDQKKGLVGEVIKDSLHKPIVNLPMPNLKIELGPKGFSARDIEDLGNAQVLVHLHQHFLSDTAVRIGSNILTGAGGGFAITHDGIEFVASLSDLQTKQVKLVARDGSELPLEIPHCLPKVACPPPEISALTVTALDDTNSLVSATLKNAAQLRDFPQLTFVIGNRVFGYSDAPFLPYDGVALRAIVPTALLVANPVLTLKPLFAPHDYFDRKPFNLSQYAQTEHIVLLEQNKESSTYLLYGSRLGSAKMISPAPATATADGTDVLEDVTGLANPPDQDTLRQFVLTSAQIKAHKQILIQRPGEHAVMVALPAGDSSPSPPTTGAGASGQAVNVSATVDLDHTRPPPVQQAPASVGDDHVVFTGDFKNLDSVLFNGTPIPKEVAADGKSVQLTGLRKSQVTANPTSQVLQFVYKSVTMPVNLEVVKKTK